MRPVCQLALFSIALLLSGCPSPEGTGGDASLLRDGGESLSDTGSPQTDAAGPGVDAGADAADLARDASELGLDAAQPGLDAGEPGLDAAEPGLDAAEPGLDAATDPPDAACAPAACRSRACWLNGSGCAPVCSGAATCLVGLDCCDGTCRDLSRNPAQCGACGCPSGQFCSESACLAASLGNVCANPRATVVLDGLSLDDQAGLKLASALSTGCSPAVQVSQVLQADAGFLAEDGRPDLGPGETFVAPGGGFGQRGVRYLDQAELSPVGVTADATGLVFFGRASGQTIAREDFTNLTDHHDLFVLEMVVEPVSGTLCLAAYGLMGPGTVAAAWLLENQVLPARASYSKSWYVFEWSDTNLDFLPNAADSFVLRGEAP